MNHEKQAGFPAEQHILDDPRFQELRKRVVQFGKLDLHSQEESSVRERAERDRLWDGIRNRAMETYAPEVRRLFLEPGIRGAWWVFETEVDALVNEFLLTKLRTILEEFDPRHPSGVALPSYLRTCVRHFVLNERQKWKRMIDRSTSLDSLAGNGWEPMFHDFDSADSTRKTRMAMVKDCVARLPSQNRELLDRHHGKRESLASIARAAGENESTIRNRYRRAVDRVRECVEGKSRRPRGRPRKDLEVTQR